MGKVTGKNFYLAFIHAGGTANFASLYREFEDGLEMETADVSSGGDTMRTYAATLQKIEPSLSGVWDDAMAAALKSAVIPGTSGTLIWGIGGSATGKPKAGITCFVTSSPTKATYDKEVEFEVSWANTGSDWVHNPATAVF